MAGGPLFAQRRASLETGLAAVRFPDDDFTVGGAWGRWTISQSNARSSGGFVVDALLAPGAATGSASLTASWRSVLWPEVIFEGHGEASAIGSSTTGNAESAIAEARLIHATANGGVWLRGSGDMARRATGAIPGGGMGVGGWTPIPSGTLGVTATRQWTRALLFAGGFKGPYLGAVPERYTEASVDLHLDTAPATLDLSAGARDDPDAAQKIEPAISATAQFWRSSNRAVVITLARLPADYIHRADAVQMVSVGMRFGARPAASRADASARPMVVLTARDEGTGFGIRASAARRVTIMADFTEWASVELTRIGELFVYANSVPAGTHRIMIQIDDGPWITAANTPAVDDDLGGRVGLLVVP
jgi:hypothetical protein